MQQAGQEQRAPKRADGRGKHLWQALRRAGKVQTLERRTPYGEALAALFPWPLVRYPGIEAGSVQLNEGRASKGAIGNWRTGRRRAPQWAYQLLAAALERRRAEIDHALALIKKETGD
jgi:hypothetical protein